MTRPTLHSGVRQTATRRSKLLECAPGDSQYWLAPPTLSVRRKNPAPGGILDLETRRAVTANPPRCWADGSSGLSIDRPVECQALGTERLGLCARHAEEILGGPDASFLPVGSLAQGAGSLAEAS